MVRSLRKGRRGGWINFTVAILVVSRLLHLLSLICGIVNLWIIILALLISIVKIVQIYVVWGRLKTKKNMVIYVTLTLNF